MISTRSFSDSNIHETHEDTQTATFADGKLHQYSANSRTRFISGAFSEQKNPKGGINTFVESIEATGGKPQKLMSLKNIVREYKNLFKNWRKETLSNPTKVRFVNFMKLLAIHFKE